MASVPKNIPKEPGAGRCGNTYKKSITVRGTIPGTDFGGQFRHDLDPVMFPPKYGTLPTHTPNFQTLGPMQDALEEEGGLEDRLWGVLNKLELDDWAYTDNQSKSLEKLTRTGMALLHDAKYRNDLSMEQRNAMLVDVLKYLRCVEYWAWRIVLYQQALYEYEPPLDITGLPQVDQPTKPDLFPVNPDALPEPPDPDAKPKAKAKPKVSPWLIVGGLGIAGAFWYFTRKK